MAIIKCKMCGGDLNIAENNSVAVCEYCGTQQTVPSADNEKKLTLFGRANRLRMACEFDKAAGVYESIVADFPEEAEAYWGLVLCKYGIEYVDDPATGKKIPTCHRSSFDSVMDDSNLEQALENADVIAQKVYREEAKQFERIRKGILEVSSSEKPYDIFICYKETDEKGDRTLDSVMAQDLYAALTDKGYRVFFSRITLQGKLGEAYEPYIFAALNSAKVMLAVGTCYEYYNAVWVKNEWSRYLKICEADKSKHLIPCYKDLDPEDMPREFKHLQGADLGKMGAVQDILFNMEKYIPLKKTVKETVVVQQAQNNATAPLLKRAFMFLEDGDWNAANEYCEKVLDIDPECAEGYLAKLMVDLRVAKQDDLANSAEPFDENANYQKAVRFADDKVRATLTSAIDSIKSRNEATRKDMILANAEKKMAVKTIANYEQAIELLLTIPGWKGADEKKRKCEKIIQELREEQEISHKKAAERAKKAKKITAIVISVAVVAISAILVAMKVIIPSVQYNKAVALVEAGRYVEAYEIFTSHTDYKDSKERAREVKDTLSYKLELLSSAEIGDSVWLGKYEQDRSTVNGKEDIEWLVLEVTNEKVLVISKYALDCLPYNADEGGITWEGSDLREWLNSDFFHVAFSEQENAMISMSTVSCETGNDTQDKIFLLSVEEAEKYVSSGEKTCQPTRYAEARGAMGSDSSDNCPWWLRTGGKMGSYAVFVDRKGAVVTTGIAVQNITVGVRPAMWIDFGV